MQCVYRRLSVTHMSIIRESIERIEGNKRKAFVSVRRLLLRVLVDRIQGSRRSFFIAGAQWLEREREAMGKWGIIRELANEFIFVCACNER